MGYRRYILILLFFLLFPVVFTLPLVLKFTTHVAGFGDVWQHIWNLWWFKSSITSAHGNPLWTDFMYWPTGASLAFHSYSPFNMVLGLFFQNFFSLPVVYNILVMKSLILSGLTGYLLGYYLSGRCDSGLICGAIWAYSSFHISRIMFFHLFSIELIPLYCFFLFRVLATQKRIYAIAAGTTLALCALCSWYYLLMLLIFSGIAFFFFFTIRQIQHILIICACALTFLLPIFFIPWQHIVRGEQFMNVSSGMATIFSADALSFFIPPEDHPLFSSLTTHFYEHVHTHHTERTSYIGIVGFIIFLSWFVLPGKRTELNTLDSDRRSPGLNCVEPTQNPFCYSIEPVRRKWLIFWLVIFLFGIVLSLGPVLHINGCAFDRIKLPFYYLRLLPIFDSIRAPHRFLMLSMLALSVGAAFGWRSMCAFFARGTSTRTVWLRSWLLVGIIILDYWTFTVFPSSDAQNIPTFYRTISADNQSYSIIDIPLPHQDFSRPLYYQTIHRKKMFGGYLSRTPDEAIKFVTSQPFLDFAQDGRLSISDSGDRNL